VEGMNKILLAASDISVNNIIENIIQTTNQLQKTYDVTVVVVNWNSGSYLKETLQSLEKTNTDFDYKVVIIDNNSNKDDASIEFIDDIITKKENYTAIMLDKNLGFGSANNLGIKITNSKYIMLLNPDVVVRNNIIKILSNYLDNHAEIGMIGPKVLNEDNSFQVSCMRGEPNPKDVLYSLCGLSTIFKKNEKFNKFSLFHLDKNQPQRVAGLSGCCMMIRKELIEKIGAFDEQFFLYQEETDWCWRAYKTGWELAYFPEAEIMHYKGVTTKKKILKNNLIFTQSMLKFFKKHHWQNCTKIEKLFWTILIWSNFFLKYIKLKLGI